MLCRKQLLYIEEPRCMKCGKPLRQTEQEYCTDCAKRPHAYEQGRSLWIHGGQVSRAVYQLKFHNKRYYAGIFAKEAVLRYGEWMRRCRIDEIIPVPLHPSRRRKRGFNQAELLSEEIGRLTGIAVNGNVIYRIRNTRPQKELDDRERYQNLKGAFGISASWKAKKNVLIVDDIYTTGSTIERIARLLKNAGVQNVYFFTISIGQGL